MFYRNNKIVVKCITMKHSRSQFELGPKGQVKYQQPMTLFLYYIY